MLTLYDQERSTETTSSTDASDRRDDSPPETVVRDIHAMATTELPRPPQRREHSSPSRSMNFSDGTSSSGENFTTVSREFNALVIAGSSMDNNNNGNNTHRDVIRVERNELMTRIGEDEDDVGGGGGHHQVPEEDSNPWAIVPDGYDNRGSENIVSTTSSGGQNQMVTTASVQRVKREEVDAKITAWQTAKVAKINNRFKRQDAVINGWLNEQIHKANSWMKKIEVSLLFNTIKSLGRTNSKKFAFA